MFLKFNIFSQIKEKMPELETSKLLSVLSEMPKELLEGYTGYTADTGEPGMHCAG